MDRVREPLPSRVQDTAPLPPEYDDAIRAGLAGMGLSITAEARTAIDGHIRLLLAWTHAINLTAIHDAADAANRHVIDSLAAVPIIRSASVARILDLGSGGGLPGIPLAAATTVDAMLVEPIGKKARFLETAVTAIGLADRIEVAAERAEVLARSARHRGAWPVVTARAVASLSELVELALPLLEPGGSLVAWKRGELNEELGSAERALRALGGGSIRLLDPALPMLPGHRLVVVTRTGHVPVTFPRDPAARRRRPW